MTRDELVRDLTVERFGPIPRRGLETRMFEGYVPRERLDAEIQRSRRGVLEAVGTDEE